MGTRRVAQQLRVPAALANNSGSILSPHMKAHYCLDFQFLGIWPSQVLGRHVVHIHMCRRNTHTCKIKKYIFYFFLILILLI